MRFTQFMRLTSIAPALAVCALVIAPASASADGMRIGVCADELVLNTKPGHGRDGVLAKGESFHARKTSRTGTYVYGLAYGHINRLGWVSARGLCNQSLVRRLSILGRRTVVGHYRVAFYSRPNLSSQIGALRAGQTFLTRKFSPSGAYAYGFAYGHLNKHGWIHSGDI